MNGSIRKIKLRHTKMRQPRVYVPFTIRTYICKCNVSFLADQCALSSIIIIITIITIIIFRHHRSLSFIARQPFLSPLILAFILSSFTQSSGMFYHAIKRFFFFCYSFVLTERFRFYLFC